MIAAGARRRAAYLLATLAIVAAGLAIFAQATGGFRTHIAGVPLSVRGALRPALAALVFALAALHLLDAWRWRLWSTLAARLALAPPIVASLAALGVLVAGLLYGSKAAGGSDPYGYVSQAMLWLRGNLIVPQAFIADMPWPNAAWSFSPLGYRPDDWAHTIKPTYAPGTPLLMALAHLVIGRCGPYMVGPLCGAGLVLLTYRLGARVSSRTVGMIAACAIATSPTVLFMASWPMSDVPAAAFWTASLLAATGRGTPAALLSGLAAGIAITIRPNLAPLAIVPAALVLATGGLRRAVLLAAAGAPFAVFIGWLFNHLYGSPLRSGYGDLAGLYAWAHVPQNLGLYARWFLDTQGPLTFLWLAAPLVAWKSGTRLALFAFAVLLLGAYLVYAPFETWTYLRFLLPAFPIAFVLSGDVVERGARRLPRWAASAALVMFGAGLVLVSATQSDARNVLDVGAHEQKFADVGKYVEAALPANAVILAQQHSGNVRFYANRLTLRFDMLEGAWLDRALAHLRGAGYEPYILLEEWEMAQFRERFAGQREAAAIERLPLAVTLDGVVRLYGTGERSAEGGSAIIPKTKGCVAPAATMGFGPWRPTRKD